MFNPYTLILGLFALAGLIVALWGWRLIKDNRRRQTWPAAAARIEHAKAPDELTPQVVCTYTVNGRVYRHEIKMADGTPPGREFLQAHLEKFPAGATVQVYYNPAQPEQVSLDNRPKRGDWLVLAAGLGAMSFGVLALFFGGQ